MLCLRVSQKPIQRVPNMLKNSLDLEILCNTSQFTPRPTNESRNTLYEGGTCAIKKIINLKEQDNIELALLNG